MYLLINRLDILEYEHLMCTEGNALETLCETQMPLSSLLSFPVSNWDDYRRWRNWNWLAVPLEDSWVINTKWVSHPLSVAFALKHLGLENTRHLIIHVLDAGEELVPAGPMWEELLHLFAGVCSLEVVFIGPKVSKIFSSSKTYWASSQKSCPRCTDAGRSRTYSFHGGSYAQFCASPHYRLPTLAVAFNASFASSPEEWIPDLSALLCAGAGAGAAPPLCVTDFSAQDAELSTALLRAVAAASPLPWHGRGLRAQRNPYGSLRPMADAAAAGTHYYHNHVIAIHA